MSTLVWSTLSPHAAHLKSLSTPDFIAMVNAAFRLSPVDLAYLHSQPAGGQADEVRWREQHTPIDNTPPLIPQRIVDVQAGTVASFPLKMRHADTYVAERVALVGCVFISPSLLPFVLSLLTRKRSSSAEMLHILRIPSLARASTKAKPTSRFS